MRTILVLLLLAPLVLLATRSSSDGATTVSRSELSTQSPGLVGLLPELTVFAAEIRGLDERWEELRALPPLAAAQDQLVAAVGLRAADMPHLSAGGLVVAFVMDDVETTLLPLAVINPPDRDDALARLAAAPGLTVIEERGALWVAAAPRADRLARVAAGDGSTIVEALGEDGAPTLAAGGLVRAWLHPRALRAALTMRAESSLGGLSASLARLLATDLRAVRALEIRRDLVGNALVTEAQVGLDRSLLPAEVLDALSAPGPALRLPADPGADVVAVGAFRTLTEAKLAWMHEIARLDPEGPFRHLDFWIDEINARLDLDLEEELRAVVGERGLFALLESSGPGLPRFAVAIEIEDQRRAEELFSGLLDWYAEHTFGRSLGLASVAHRSEIVDGAPLHRLALRTPLGELVGPLLRIEEGRLLLATDRAALLRAAEFASTSFETSAPGSDAAPLAIVELGDALPEFGRRWADDERHPLCSVLGTLLGGVRGGGVTVGSDGEGLRLRGQLVLDDETPDRP